MINCDEAGTDALSQPESSERRHRVADSSMALQIAIAGMSGLCLNHDRSEGIILTWPLGHWLLEVWDDAVSQQNAWCSVRGTCC